MKNILSFGDFIDESMVNKKSLNQLKKHQPVHQTTRYIQLS